MFHRRLVLLLGVCGVITVILTAQMFRLSVVEGSERLAATCRDAGDELADMEAANRTVGELVRGRAATDAPKVSGRLAGSLRVSSVTKSEVVVASDLVYAAPINFGWPARNISAQPFMSNALNESEKFVLQTYEARVGAAVSGVKGA